MKIKAKKETKTKTNSIILVILRRAIQPFHPYMIFYKINH